MRKAIRCTRHETARWPSFTTPVVQGWVSPLGHIMERLSDGGGMAAEPRAKRRAGQRGRRMSIPQLELFQQDDFTKAKAKLLGIVPPSFANKGALPLPGRAAAGAAGNWKRAAQGALRIRRSQEVLSWSTIARNMQLARQAQQELEDASLPREIFFWKHEAREMPGSQLREAPETRPRRPKTPANRVERFVGQLQAGAAIQEEIRRESRLAPTISIRESHGGSKKSVTRRWHDAMLLPNPPPAPQSVVKPAPIEIMDPSSNVSYNRRALRCLLDDEVTRAQELGNDKRKLVMALMSDAFRRSAARNGVEVSSLLPRSIDSFYVDATMSMFGGHIVAMTSSKPNPRALQEAWARYLRHEVSRIKKLALVLTDTRRVLKRRENVVRAAFRMLTGYSSQVRRPSPDDAARGRSDSGLVGRAHRRSITQSGGDDRGGGGGHDDDDEDDDDDDDDNSQFLAEDMSDSFSCGDERPDDGFSEQSSDSGSMGAVGTHVDVSDLDEVIRDQVLDSPEFSGAIERGEFRDPRITDENITKVPFRAPERAPSPGLVRETTPRSHDALSSHYSSAASNAANRSVAQSSGATPSSARMELVADIQPSTTLHLPPMSQLSSVADETRSESARSDMVVSRVTSTTGTSGQHRGDASRSSRSDAASSGCFAALSPASGKGNYLPDLSPRYAGGDAADMTFVNQHDQAGMQGSPGQTPGGWVNARPGPPKVHEDEEYPQAIITSATVGSVPRGSLRSQGGGVRGMIILSSEGSTPSAAPALMVDPGRWQQTRGAGRPQPGPGLSVLDDIEFPASRRSGAAAAIDGIAQRSQLLSDERRRMAGATATRVLSSAATRHLQGASGRMR